MIYTRGQPQDYDGWAALGCTGWGWGEVLPLFKRIEHNQRGAARGMAAADRAGQRPAHAEPAQPRPLSRPRSVRLSRQRRLQRRSQEGVGLYQVFQTMARRHHAGRAFLDGPAARPTSRDRRSAGAADRVEGARAVGVTIGRLGDERTCAHGARSCSAPAHWLAAVADGVRPGAGERLARTRHRVVVDAPEVGAQLQDHSTTRQRADQLALACSASPRARWPDPRQHRRVPRARGACYQQRSRGGGFVDEPARTRPARSAAALLHRPGRRPQPQDAREHRDRRACVRAASAQSRQRAPGQRRHRRGAADRSEFPVRAGRPGTAARRRADRASHPRRTRAGRLSGRR